jgi:hypothetical protein
MEDSGLDRVRPNVCINFSRPAGYVELLENVQIHGYHLMLETGRALDSGEIAGDWYERVYLPAVEAIRREGLDQAYPDATEADSFSASTSFAETSSRTALMTSSSRRSDDEKAMS